MGVGWEREMVPSLHPSGRDLPDGPGASQGFIRVNLLLPGPGAGPASACGGLAAPRTCSLPMPTPQSLSGTRDFVFVDLFASSPPRSEGCGAVQPGGSGLRVPGSLLHAHKGPSHHGPAGNLETGQVSSWGRDVGRDPLPLLSLQPSEKACEWRMAWD